MAIGSTAVWEVRTTGSDSNGGMYTSGGTDYSQQDAAQLSLTDVVTNATTNVSSAAGGFTSAMVGNGINIAGTVYQIMTFLDSHNVNVERAIGAASGQTGKVGGALATPGFACGQMGGQNTVWIKAGTYSITSASANIAGGCLLPPSGSKTAGYTRIFGYGAVRGDNGSRPVLQASGISGVPIVSGVAISYLSVANLIADGNSLSTMYGFDLSGAAGEVYNCMAQNCTGAGGIGFLIDNDCWAIYCEASNCGYGFNTQAPYNQVAYSYAHGCSVSGFYGAATFTGCLAASNLADGFQLSGASGAGTYDCTSYGNTGSGFKGIGVGRSGPSVNCISYGNSAYGFNELAVDYGARLFNCAAGANASGNINTTNVPAAQVGFVALSADPFVSAGTNFGLNTTAGGGGACRAAGFPGALPGLAGTVSKADIGAVQHADPAGGGTAGGARLSLSL